MRLTPKQIERIRVSSVRRADGSYQCRLQAPGVLIPDPPKPKDDDEDSADQG